MPTSEMPLGELSSHLDARRCAMLEEMGVRVWRTPHQIAKEGLQRLNADVGLPTAKVRPSSIVKAAQSLPTQTSHVRGSTFASTEPAILKVPGIDATMDLSALRGAAMQCQACRLCTGRRHSVWDALPKPLPDGTPRWLFVLDAPSIEENATGDPIHGDAGKLLKNMAAAIQLQPQQVYCSHATKCAPAAGHRVGTTELTQCAAWLRHEMALVQPKVVLAMGRHAAFSVLGSTDPLGQLRGKPYRVMLPTDSVEALSVLSDVVVVVTYAPAYLLRNPAAKRQAWQDLCLARSLADVANLV